MHDIKAMKMWNELPDDFRKRVIENEYCITCRSDTSIVDYSITDDKGNILIKGKCAKCGSILIRVVD